MGETKYMFMSHHQNAGQNHSTKTASKSFSEKLTKFRYLGMTVMNGNCIHEEIVNRLNLGNGCCYAAQSLCLPIWYLKT
jgi:hypothetical protein